MAIDIDFEWHRDEAGYELLPAGPPDPTLRDALAVATARVASVKMVRPDGSVEPPKPRSRRRRPAPPYDRIVGRSGKLIEYRPLERFPGLWKTFAASVSTKETLLDFVVNFGPLTDQMNEEPGEDVRFGLRLAKRMRELRRLAPEDRAAYLSRRGDLGIPCGIPTVSLVLDPATKAPRLRFRPMSLADALSLDFGFDVSNEQHTTRECMLCGNLFDAGPGTGRRADAKFCSDPHRIAFNSRNRPPASQKRTVR